MSIVVSWRGSNYTVPEPDDAFTQSLTDYLKAITTGALAIPNTGTAADLGTFAGLAALYLQSKTANQSASGVVRLAKSDVLGWRNNANGADVAQGINLDDQPTFAGIPFGRNRVVVTYGVSMTPDSAAGDQFVITATNGVAFTINAPANPVTGHRFTLRIRNTSGGALGVATFNAVFKLSAWTQPATGQSRAIIFEYDGANWIEASRTTVDVPN